MAQRAKEVATQLEPILIMEIESSLFVTKVYLFTAVGIEQRPQFYITSMLIS